MNQLQYEIQHSGLIHYPLPLHPERSLETKMQNAAVLKERTIPALSIPDSWQRIGNDCQVSAGGQTPSDAGSVCFCAQSPCGARPNGRLEQGDCSNFGRFGIQTSLPAESWEDYNRISFFLRADCEGVRHVTVTLAFENDGKIKIPDIYNREGFHNINLVCGEWRHVILEIGTLPRDRIIGLKLYAGMVGCETDSALGNRLCYSAGDFRLEKTEEEENTLGWSLPAGKIAYSYSGYLPGSSKTAVAGIPAGSRFTLKDENGAVVYSGISTAYDGYPGISVLDFSSVVQEGNYRICTDGLCTEPFAVSIDAFLSSIWKTVNFLFCERCGYPVPGSHVSCHRDMLAHHGKKSILCNGGWHDAGDLSQQLVQTAEITCSLLEAAHAYSADTSLSLRLREEALWGLDYVLHSRFGDGFRATSVGISMWTDNVIGSRDDLSSRCHNNAYENFLCAGAEAYSSLSLRDSDPLLADRVLTCARQDFSFAMDKFSQTGFSERPPEYWEHTWMTSPSLFAATMSWAASQLYRCTQETSYAEAAARYGDYVVSCQANVRTGNSGFPAWGFFYRSPEKKSLQHFNHQARDQYYMMALTELCYTQPSHPSASKWRMAIRLYADYLLALTSYGNPYGMMPSGLYRKEEIEDAEAFARQHLETGDEVYEDYAQQLENAQDLGDGFYLKQFPVWFSFRGNNAVILSMGKSASLCGRFFNDQRLLSIAADQLEWNLGKNPFRQSLMYGEGQRYAQQYATMPGEMTGELPVGVQTMGNGDEPYWPQMNNATYKEVWTSPSARWLSILADLNGAL